LEVIRNKQRQKQDRKHKLEKKKKKKKQHEDFFLVRTKWTLKEVFGDSCAL
jgi:hypothetical protein